MNTLLMHCRPGFEGEVCAEIAEHAATLEIPGYAKSKPASAHVEFVCQDADGAERLMRRLRFADLIFPRQWARGPGFIELPESQRIEVLLDDAERDGVLEALLAAREFDLEILPPSLEDLYRHHMSPAPAGATPCP